jgi:hypothetical protein
VPNVQYTLDLTESFIRHGASSAAGYGQKFGKCVIESSGAGSMEAASSPITDQQRQDLQQRLVDNFNALLFHREVPCSSG